MAVEQHIDVNEEFETKQDVFSSVFNYLSTFSDDELLELDFDSVESVLNDYDISSSEREKLTRLFSSIKAELSQLKHYGILGMKWGVRRYQNEDGSLTPAGEERYRQSQRKESIFGTAKQYDVKTRSGDVITIEPLKEWSIGRKIAKGLLLGVQEKEVLGRRGDANYTLKNSEGKKIGELSLISKKNDTAYIDWITVDKKNRGKGYATDIINDLLVKAKDSGYSTVSLNALKAPRPLYERIGFTYADNRSTLDKIGNFEFGTKHMEYDLEKLKHSDILAHYGILGMKWGVRRYQNEDGTLTSAGKTRYADKNEKTAAKKEKTKAAVREYSKAYDKLMADQEAHDSKRQQLDEMYKATGKNKIDRVINVAKMKTSEAKAYSKAYDDWTAKQDILDERFSKLEEKYKATGKNKLSRVINNMKYGS